MTLADLRRRLMAPEVTCRELVDACLERIADPAGEGRRTFIRVFDDVARADADALDQRLAAGEDPGPLAGMPLGVKDLFDIEGQVTLAGSALRRDAPPASRDAEVVSRLRRAGAVLLGTTNMSEFALGTIGTNPHYGTPRNPWDRGAGESTGRAPGGSSSGCAVAVTDDMAVATVGTDTAGSVRVPAALCGLTGFKPTARRVSRMGVFPLSESLDSVGPLARSVDCCARLDAVLADEPVQRDEVSRPAPDAAHLTLGVLTTLVQDDLDGAVAAAYAGALETLRAAGVELVELSVPALERIPGMCAHGGISLVEARVVHRDLLERAPAGFDGSVLRRLVLAGQITPADYRARLAARTALIAEVAPLTAPFDAVLMPTCPQVAPTLADVADAEVWDAINRRYVQSNIIANLLDRCALSLPCGAPGGPPVGLTLMGPTLGDRRLLAFGATVERLLRREHA